MNDLATRSLLDREGLLDRESLLDREDTGARQDVSTPIDTASVDAALIDTALIDTPATRDFPLPSRSLRLGLGRDLARDDAPLSTDTVSTTEILLPTQAPAVTSAARTETASVPAPPKPKHRLQAPPAALRARTALLAIAAGATAMAVTGSAGDGQPTPLASTPAPAPVDAANVTPAAHVTDNGAPRAVGSVSGADLSDLDSQLAIGTADQKAKAAAEAAKRRPLVVSPLPLGTYSLTSAFAPRWGSFHGGLDLAAPLGTPIHAATDGVVIAAGPASGYGHWIQIQAPDGTVTMYGHMSASGVNVSKGEKVTAGDIIGLVGSEGFSTGPHVHFERWVPKGGHLMKVDPAPWLAQQGVKLSALTN